MNLSPRFSLIIFLVLAAAPSYAAERLNIVLFFTDDHTRQALSAYNHELKLIETPNLDRIAREGMLFERALVTNSICGPSRAVVLTGKHSHINGFVRNGNRFDGSQPTFPKMLQAAGYQTALIGKWHLASDPTGFDHWHILPGQGIYYNPPMIRDGTRVVHEGYVTDLITGFSLEWLRKRDKSRPFLLMSQHKAPHREWAPALRHLNWNKDRPFPEPETLFDDYSGRGSAERNQDMSLLHTFTDRDTKLLTPPYLNAEQRRVWDEYYAPRNEEFLRSQLSERDLVRWRYQRYMHDYLGTILAVDESVGEILKYLDEEGLADNTLVVYASDQGFYLGEHGWFDKRWIYEESVTTPLIVRWPGVTTPGTRSPAMVGLIDLASTFLEAARLPVPDDIQGRSLLPILRGQVPSDWRQSFYYHYYEFPGPHRVEPHYGVITDRYKLFYFYREGLDPNYWTLIDRMTDPHELTNVYGQPAYASIQRELHAELERLRLELRVPDEDPLGTGDVPPGLRRTVNDE